MKIFQKLQPLTHIQHKHISIIFAMVLNREVISDQLCLDIAHIQAMVIISNSREYVAEGKQLEFFLRTGSLRDTGMVSKPKVLSSPLQEWLVWQLASWMTCGTRFMSIFSLVGHVESRERVETDFC